MITQTVKYNGFTSNKRNTSEFFCLSTDEKPTKNVQNADVLYFMDWNSLTDEQKTAAVSQIWMYDAQNGVWLPQ